MNFSLILFFVIVLLANMTEVVAGFGSVLLAVTLGAYLYSVEQLVSILVPLNFLLGVILIFKFHREINFKILFRRILPITGLGMPVGIYLFNFAPHQVVKPVFGFLVMVLAADELWNSSRQHGSRVPLSFWKANAFLFAGGVIQGLYASGGPPVVYYSVREFENKSEMRSTLAGLWIILNLVLMVSLVSTGKINRESLTTTGLLIPAMVLGFLIGNRIHHRVSDRIFRTTVYALLAVAGLGLLLT